MGFWKKIKQFWMGEFDDESIVIHSKDLKNFSSIKRIKGSLKTKKQS